MTLSNRSPNVGMGAKFYIVKAKRGENSLYRVHHLVGIGEAFRLIDELECEAPIFQRFFHRRTFLDAHRTAGEFDFGRSNPKCNPRFGSHRAVRSNRTMYLARIGCCEQSSFRPRATPKR